MGQTWQVYGIKNPHTKTEDFSGKPVLSTKAVLLDQSSVLERGKNTVRRRLVEPNLTAEGRHSKFPLTRAESLKDIYRPVNTAHRLELIHSSHSNVGGLTV